MQIIKSTINVSEELICNLKYHPVFKECEDNSFSLPELLFFDIETTGFDVRRTVLYLIGIVFYEDLEWKSLQWLADSKDEEIEILKNFLSFVDGYHYLLHFNGDSFDIPYIIKKCAMYHLPTAITKLKSIDLYKGISPYKKIIKLPNLKQKTLEIFLSVDREDNYTGEELISIYNAYCLDHDAVKLNSILLHNFEDIYGLLKILPILKISELKNEVYQIVSYELNTYKAINGCQRKELLVTVSSSICLPFSLTLHNNYFYCIRNADKIKLRISIIDDTLKHFYTNYKEYYFLPEENMAIHKSLAVYVDKNHRIKATASNCYMQKSGTFLPLPSCSKQTDYQYDYKDKQYFMELSDDYFKDIIPFTTFIKDVIQELYFY